MHEPHAPNIPTATPRQQQIVMWVLWAAFLGGIIMFRIFLAQPAGRDAIPWAFALIPALLSTGIRWQLLPRMKHAQQGLVCMILGLASAEATCFFGLFLAPSKLDVLFVASLLAAAQFAPVWARRFFPVESKPPVANLIPRPPR